nr:MAG: hypothetical protein DIU80_24065 [Chloroflexota bacterium]
MPSKEIKQLIKALRRQGFGVRTQGCNHPKVYLDGRLVETLPLTPSDYHAFANTIAGLRRAGFVYKGR